MFYANTMGITSKKASVISVFSKLAPDIGLFCETHLNDKNSINIEGYSFIGRPRTIGTGGGVGILVKESRKLHIAPHYSSRDIEILWVSINRKRNKPLFVGVYYGKQEGTPQ